MWRPTRRIARDFEGMSRDARRRSRGGIARTLPFAACCRIDRLKYRRMTAEAQAAPLPSIFRLPGFRTIWIAQFISIFGDFLALFGIISFITFRLHGTAVQVTTITIAYILPLAVFGPVAGVLVDRFDVKRTMIASDLIRGFLALLFIICATVPQI